MVVIGFAILKQSLAVTLSYSLPFDSLVQGSESIISAISESGTGSSLVCVWGQVSSASVIDAVGWSFSQREALVRKYIIISKDT